MSEEERAGAGPVGPSDAGVHAGERAAAGPTDRPGEGVVGGERPEASTTDPERLGVDFEEDARHESGDDVQRPEALTTDPERHDVGPEGDRPGDAGDGQDPTAFPTAVDPDGPIDARTPPPMQSGLASSVEALLFLSSEPVAINDLAVACDTGPDEIVEALKELQRAYAPGRRGLLMRQIGGGYLLSTAPETEPAARRLLTAPRTPAITPAQAETLAIVAYLQPVSRPEITRIRGVAADSACNTLVERGLIEEAGRSQFGAVLYRTTGLFLKLFGLDGLADLPEPSAWDPTPEETATLRERLMIAGDARSGADPTTGEDRTGREGEGHARSDG